MMRSFMIELLICVGLLLTGCNTVTERAIEPNEFNCEENYTYDQEKYSSDDVYYDYQEPHETFEHAFGSEKDIAFLYGFSYDPSDLIENGLVIMNNGDVFSADISVFEYIENVNFDNIEPIKTLEEDIMNEYLELLDDVVPCKPVNIDERPSCNDDIKKYINIYGVKGATQIKLFHSGEYIETSTDENATEIVEWMGQLYNEIFPE